MHARAAALAIYPSASVLVVAEDFAVLHHENKAFKTDVPGLYSLVAQKGAAATAAAVKVYQTALDASRLAAKKAAASEKKA